MPKDKKDSRFDRVISVGKKAGDWMSSDVKPLKKMDSKMESYMQSKANKAMSEGKETKAKAYAAAEGVRKAVTPTTKGEVAGIAAGAAGKAVSKVGNAIKISKSVKASKAAENVKRGRVAIDNSVEALERSRMHRYGYGLEGRIKTTAGKGKGSSKSTFYDTPTTEEKVGRLMMKDHSNTFTANNAKESIRQANKYKTTESANDIKYAKEDLKRFTTKEEFTSRGKPVGKKIGDQGGSPSKANKAKREKMGDNAKFYKQVNSNKRDIKRWGKRDWGKGK